LLTIPLLLLSAPLSAAPPEPIELRDWQVLPPVGEYGRQFLHADPIEARVIRDEFTAPSPDDRVLDRARRAQTWSPLTAGEDGWLRSRQLNGGYAWTQATLDQPGVYVLRAQGHSLVYVNGQIRGGDPYSAGTLAVPVALRAGQNTFLFQVGRGRLRASLTPAESAAAFNPADLTLPDLLAEQPGALHAGVPVLNLRDATATGLEIVARVGDAEPCVTALPPLAPLSVYKAPIRLNAPSLPPGTPPAALHLALRDAGTVIAELSETLPIRAAGDRYKRTFISDIDGSCQYFAVTPATPREGAAARPALFLTLHGASVEARGQAAAYAPKDWGHVVAPTNRRPYGFDWEDWGRLDALEVLEIASRELNVDPQRVYLTGHSMGGHGTWHVGLTFPDRFAAIAPSAGWVSFWTYTGAARYEADTPVESALRRAASASDTLALIENARAFGVYVLHGDADDNVPVSQARTMRTELAKFHADFAYYERPGAGHWWGDACVDWPPLFQFFSERQLRPSNDVRNIHFVSASPGVSHRCHWVVVHAQRTPHLHSTVDFAWDPEARTITGTTQNVAVLAFDTARLAAGSLSVSIDGQTLGEAAPAAGGQLVWLAHRDGAWSVLAAPPPAGEKSPARDGLFKTAFTNRFTCVYGTGGDEAENAALLSRARYDADTFAYRGNGAVRVLADHAFDPTAAPDENVVLYGNASNNSAWDGLLSTSPLQVSAGRVSLGASEWTGDAFGGVLIRPRPGSDRASVGAVFGTGRTGLRLTERIPYFLSGVGVPDYVVMQPAVLEGDVAGVVAAGFFSRDWSFAGDSEPIPTSAE